MTEEDMKKAGDAEAVKAAEGVAQETNEAVAEEAQAAAPAGEAPEQEEVPVEEVSVSEKPDEAAVLKDRLLRLQADFDNYRKRQARERTDFVTQASADVLEAMLAPMDHLEMAIETMSKKVSEEDPFLAGVKMVRDEMLAAFKKHSLEPMETKVGAELDPTCEEALGLLPIPGIAEDHIAVVVRKGYRLHGKVLRAAQVMAGTGAPAVETASGEEA